MSGTDHSIERGDLVIAVDAEGEELPRRALGGPMDGSNFLVVWVCREEEWHTAQREGREPDGVPWPAEDVRARVPADTTWPDSRAVLYDRAPGPGMREP